MNEHLDGTGSAHPIMRCLDALERELDDVVDAPTWSLDAAETTQGSPGWPPTRHGSTSSKPAP